MRLTVTLNGATAPAALQDDLARAFAAHAELSLLMALLGEDADLQVRLQTENGRAHAQVSLQQPDDTVTREAS